MSVTAVRPNRVSLGGACLCSAVLRYLQEVAGVGWPLTETDKMCYQKRSFLRRVLEYNRNHGCLFPTPISRLKRILLVLD